MHKQTFFKFGFIVSIILFLLATIVIILLATRNPLITPIHVKLPQNAFDYIDQKNQNQLLITKQNQHLAAKQFLEHFFHPWNKQRDFLVFNVPNKKINILQSEDQIIKALRKNPGWGENFQKHSQKWLQQIINNMNLARYPNRHSRAIVVHSTNLRLIPTNSPSFENYHLAGQGYPFDNLQVSRLWAGEPLHVLQLTKNGAWALIVGPTMFGWIKTTNMAYVSQHFITIYKTDHYAVMIKDFVPIKDHAGHFLIFGRIGSLLPKENSTLLVPVATADRQAVIKRVHLKQQDFRRFPWTATSAHFATIINALIGEPYGWGGIYGYRDCSATIKDLYTTFGIWMPRNSAWQQATGKRVDVSAYQPKEKTAYILKHAKPFLTVIGLRGHIMLYIGQKNGQPLVFHNVWGLHTSDWLDDQGRAVVGGADITFLTLGKHIHRATALLKKVISVTTVGPFEKTKRQ